MWIKCNWHYPDTVRAFFLDFQIWFDLRKNHGAINRQLNNLASIWTFLFHHLKSFADWYFDFDFQNDSSGGADSLGNYGAAGDTSMATSYFNNFQLQQNKLPGMGMYGLPPFYGDFYGKKLWFFCIFFDQRLIRRFNVTVK